MDALIVVAGATGNLGRRLVGELLERKVRVRALVRSRNAEAMALQRHGVELYDADFSSEEALAEGCMGARCVVSTLSGLRELVVDAQERLVDAAVSAGCRRFIPSDFALEFYKLPKGRNRNLDLRRELAERIEDKNIALTSVLNGAFMELLLGAAPLLVFPLRRAVYFGDAKTPLDFTAIDDVAKYTSYAAIDDSTPRFLRIAGDILDAEQLAAAASRATGKHFKTFRAGDLHRLEQLIWLMRRFGGEDQVFPPWQGMQYLRDMFDGRGKLAPLDNDRYPQVRFTTVRELLERRDEVQRRRAAA